MQNDFCPHCWPTKRKNHFGVHADYYIDETIYQFFLPFRSLPFFKYGKSIHDFIRGRMLEIMALLKIVSFNAEPDESRLYNRSLIFFKEAKKRNLDIKAIMIFDKYMNEFQLTHNNKKYYYDDIPLNIFNETPLELDRKDDIKKILRENGLPIAEGNIFINEKAAFDFGKSLGFPLVVKPSNGSLSQHVTCPIISEAELINAIKIAKQYSPAFIVEKFITGKLYRATVVAQKHVFICRKEKANVIGDGVSTIEKLIGEKNKHPFRGNTLQQNTTLHQIPITDTLITNLQKKDLSLDSVVPKNEKIYLMEKFVLSHGCDIINCGAETHLETKEMFLQTAKILKTDLVGIDFICPDITKSYKAQENAILETNGLPYIDMHQFPSHGEPDRVAEIVWDSVLEKLK